MTQNSNDNNNPGRKQCEEYGISGGISASNADSLSSARLKKQVKFRLLKNCIVDKRLGAVMKRPGSVTETIIAGLGLPLGMGEYTEGVSGLMPLNRTLLVNFGGSAFYQLASNIWSAVSFSSRCSFSTSLQNQFTKLADYMFIAGGKPAQWQGPGTIIDRIGIVPPVNPIAITSTATAGDITSTDGASYMYTYFDSDTGLESDWSPLSASTGALTSKRVNISIPTFTVQNFDSVRIYRTFDGGSIPYLVATVDYTITTFEDNVTDAQLTARAADRYDHALPPDNSELVVKFAQCIWWRDAANPHVLRFSKPYTGDQNDLLYYPVDNELISDNPITGWLVTPSKLLLFHPRGISFISGTNVDDFQFFPWMPGVGTVFPNSISTNGERIVFLSEQGFVSIPSGGGAPEHISREIDEQLQPLLAGSYNGAIYVSSAWNPSLRQFVFMITALSTAGQPWEVVGSGAIGLWQTTTLVDDTWEAVDGTSGSASMRVKIWGWSPELSGGGENLWMEYTFPSILDSNVDSAYPLFLFHPQPSNNTSDPQQDKTYIGIFNGSDGRIISAFRRDSSLDDAARIISELITERITPGDQRNGYKMFCNLAFDNSFTDPTFDTFGLLSYLLDFTDPELRSYSGSLISISNNNQDMKKFTQTLGKHIHLRILDTSNTASKILLSDFFIWYRERFRQQGR